MTKPWFYSWALMSRFFPVGATIYSSSNIEPNTYPNGILKPALSGISPAPGFRVLSAKLRRNNKVDWTFCLVNNSDKPNTITVKAIDGGPVKFNRYLYSKESSPLGKDEMPTSVGLIEGDLGTGVAVTCPPSAVCLVTTIE